MDDDDLKAADRADRVVFFCAMVIALWLGVVW